MSASATLLALLGEVALLLWAVHLVGESLRRAIGGQLRFWLSKALQSRARSFGAGLFITTLLQSSTAAALMVTSLSSLNSVPLSSALAVMLGANVGTTLIVQIVSVKTQLMPTFLILVGVVLSRLTVRSAWRDGAGAIIGLGLILLSLQLMGETLRPASQSQVLHVLFASFKDDLFFNMLIGAIFAWIAHSSAATILLAMSFVSHDVVTVQASLSIILGANLGSAFNPLSAAAGSAMKFRVAFGNLFTRVAGCIIVAPIIPLIAPYLWAFDQSERVGADFHVLFNMAMAAFFLPLLPSFARLLSKVFPDPAQGERPGSPLYLDEASLASPTVAMANASREALRMADIVNEMLLACGQAFSSDDRDAVRMISRRDDELDSLYSAIHAFLSRMDHSALTQDEGHRIGQIIALIINLEHVGDIIDSNLMQIAANRIENQVVLADRDLALVRDMLRRLSEDLQLAMAVFMQGDLVSARLLVAKKEEFRIVEREATQRHLDLMRCGRFEDVRVSAVLIDITRDLKRIEAHLAATAYGILEECGQLRRSRLA